MVGSTLFGTATTGTSGGAANSMFDSYTALGGLVLILTMMLGEVSPGGVGAGLYAILVLAIITVFLTGLLLGRAPMVLGNKIRTREVKLVSLFILVMPALALTGMAISFGIPALHREMQASMGNDGLHGFTEVLYAFILDSAAVSVASVPARIIDSINIRQATLLRGAEWVVEDVAGRGVVDRSRATLSFSADGRVAGRGSCNRYTAGYSISGEGLTISKPASTMMACEPALMQQEQLFFELLGQVRRFTIDQSGALVLHAADGRTIAARRP